MGCFAASQVCEGGSGRGFCNATFLSQCGAVQGDDPGPSPPAHRKVLGVRLLAGGLWVALACGV